MCKTDTILFSIFDPKLTELVDLESASTEGWLESLEPIPLVFTLCAPNQSVLTPTELNHHCVDLISPTNKRRRWSDKKKKEQWIPSPRQAG